MKMDNKKRKINRISFWMLTCAVVIFLVGCGDGEKDEPIQQERQNWTWATLEQEPREGYSSEEEFMSEQEWLEYQGFAGKEPFYRFDFSMEYCDYELIFYCAEDRESGGGILKRKGFDTQKWAFTFQGSEKYLTDSVTPFSVYAEYSDGKETFFLHGETIVEHFEKRNADGGEEFARFGYSEDGRLQYMTEERPHGCVWRFYIYDGKADVASRPDYVLELDPGWGAAFYRFDG